VHSTRNNVYVPEVGAGNETLDSSKKTGGIIAVAWVCVVKIWRLRDERIARSFVAHFVAFLSRRDVRRWPSRTRLLAVSAARTKYHQKTWTSILKSLFNQENLRMDLIINCALLFNSWPEVNWHFSQASVGTTFLGFRSANETSPAQDRYDETLEKMRILRNNVLSDQTINSKPHSYSKPPAYPTFLPPSLPTCCS